MKRGMMKNSAMLTALFLIFLIPLVSANPGLEIIPASSSSPVQTNSYFTLNFDVKNTGASTTQNIICMINLKYGFSVYAGSPEKNIGAILTGQTKNVSYELRVDENTVSGSHNLNIKCKEENAIDWISTDAIVQVESKYGTLNIANVRTEPKIIEPGQKGIVYVTLDNKADYLMNEINVKLNLSGVNIAPYGETTEKKFGSISAKSSQDISFGIVVLPETAGGIYKIPVEVTYKDVTTKSYSISSFISVEIGSPPEIDVSIESSSIYGSIRTGNVIIKLVNRGLTDIKLLSAKLEKGEGFDILSSEEVYIGNVDSDEYETAEFKISVGRFKKDMVLPLMLEFRDSSNNLYSIERNVTFRKLSASESGKSSSSILWIIFGVAAIAAYFYYRHRKKKKKLMLE